MLCELAITTADVDKKVSGPLKQLFSIQKGNQNLTEVAIYRYISQGQGVPVYGGGAKAPRFSVKEGMLRENGGVATLFEAPALMVAMDGSSGSIQVIESGKFYCNHHGAVMKPKIFGIDLWCTA